MKVLAIIGSGDLGQQIAHYALTDNHYQKVVFFDDFSKESISKNGVILGNTSIILDAFENKLFDELIIGIGYKHLQKKKEIFEKFSGKVPFGKIVHSTSWVDISASVAAGCVVYPSCCIDANAIVRENTILNIGCNIAHDTIIGGHCFLSPRVAIAGFVIVEEQCILGINSTVIDSIRIKNNSQLGAGTVVIKSIDKSGLYVGNPAKFIR